MNRWSLKTKRRSMISMIDKSLMFNYCERSCQAANLLVGEVRPLDAALQRNQYRLVRVCSPIIADRNSQIRLSHPKIFDDGQRSQKRAVQSRLIRNNSSVLHMDIIKEKTCSIRVTLDYCLLRQCAVRRKNQRGKPRIIVGRNILSKTTVHIFGE